MMMTRQTVLRTALAAGLVSVAVAGCGMMQPAQKMDIYEAALTGAQEVPPNTSAGRGMAEIQYDSSKNTLTLEGDLQRPLGPGHRRPYPWAGGCRRERGHRGAVQQRQLRSRSRAKPPSRPRSSVTWPRTCGT